uniref:Phosphotransferase n=1 Tax=Aceria tosichella TaxID=561515 RepID=A0A6G1S3I3_9ACAR
MNLVSMPATTIETKINKWFHLNDDALSQIKDSLQAEFELGLRDEEAASIKMLITYVRELSLGDEIGSYLALDLGGTHFRVLLVTLMGDGSEPKVTSVTHDIPLSLLRTQNGHELFDYIALRLLEFVKQYKLKRRRISLGFTFSFPCKQYGLTQSVLVKWCKGFNVGGVVGTDVVRQLKDALKRQLAGLVEAYIDVVAVINDTTGTLVACANKNKDCRIGLIVGTGFNACYMETLDRCEKWPANYTNPKQVIVNCEWGAMGDHKDRRELDKFRNEFDEQIDRDSVNPMNQTYEKMVAGLYVGELLRLAMLHLYNCKLLFATSNSPSCCSARNRERGRLTTTKSTQSSSSASRVSPQSGQQQQVTPAQANNPRHQSKSKSKSSQTKSAPNESSSGSNERHKLNVKDIMNGKHLSLLAKDEQAGSFEETIKIMKELNIQKYSESDLAIVVRLGAAIMQRSANLVACGIAALLDRVQRKFTVIGYDGSVIKYHPYFLARVVEKTTKLARPDNKFEFIQSSDGSGIGAAVVAAALHKERRPLYVVKPGKLYEMHLLRSQLQQSQLSFGEGISPPLPGMERVGSSSSRASSASMLSSVGGSSGQGTPPRSPSLRRNNSKIAPESSK